MRIIFVLAAVVAAGQSPGPVEARRIAPGRAERIAGLSANLRYHTEAEHQRYMNERDAWTKQIHGEVDAYMGEIRGPGFPSPSGVADELTHLLSKSMPERGYADPVTARLAADEGGVAKYLLVSYSLSRGGAVDEAATTVRAYLPSAAGLRLVASGADDMEGYPFFIRELSSPRRGEWWFLLYGFTGSNGPHRRRIRVIAFDGSQFRTVWAPDDQYDDGTFESEVSVTGRGNVISAERLDVGRYYGRAGAPYHFVDEYLVSSDGVSRITSRAVD